MKTILYMAVDKAPLTDGKYFNDTLKTCKQQVNLHSLFGKSLKMNLKIMCITCLVKVHSV